MSLPRVGRYLKHPSGLVDSSLAPIYVENSIGEEVWRGHTMQERLVWSIDFWKSVDHPVAGVSDVRELRNSTAKGRRDYGEFQATVDPYQEKHMIALATVFANEEQRGIITAVQWQRKAKLSRPMKTFLDLDEAIAWVRKVLGEHDVRR